MARTQGLYINLHVSDLARTRSFYTALGFEIDERFSDDNAVAVALGEGQVAMMLKRDFFQTFTDRALADPTQALQCLIAIELDSREAVDTVVQAALAHGGAEPRPPQDHGFMFQRTFTDPDGHAWEPFWMDAAALQDDA